MVKRAVIYAALALSMLVVVAADSGWEGNAVVARYGVFPPEGYYGASNSFARNSVVTVTSLETGRSVDLIIAARATEPGVFLAVSEEAAELLGMQRGSPARVRVVPIVAHQVAPPTVVREQPFSSDPDINPLAELGDPDRPYLLAVEPPPSPIDEPAVHRGVAGGVARSAAVVPTRRAVEGDDVGSVDAPRAPAVQPLEPADPAPVDPPLLDRPLFAPPAAVAETNRMQEAVAGVRGRVPPKELHPPPRQEEVYTFLDVPRDLAIPRAVEPRLAEAPLPDEAALIAERPAAESLGKLEEPRRPLMVELPPARPPDEPPAELALEEEPGEEPGVAVVEDEDVILRLEPAEPAVAVDEPEPAEAVAEPLVTVDEWALASLPVQPDLEVSSYYLQIGAFASPRSARNMIDRLEDRYPFTVTSVAVNDRTLYRVFVGPLLQDETGVVLHQLRARGYRDAFIRRGGA